MSTIAYAQLTNKRDKAKPGKSTKTEAPGLQTYVDALAALVPSEVLTLHALIVAATTEMKKVGTDQATVISAPETLVGAFYGLIVLSIVLYVVPRVLSKQWDWGLDWFRASIPPLAFMGWTMLQRTTAFDAVYPDMPGATRTVIALFIGAILGFLAGALAYRADQKKP